MADSKPSPFRNRQCMFVLYPESQQPVIDFVQQNYPCAWALHDKDTHTQGDYDAYIAKHDGQKPDWNPGDIKKPHIHFVCRFSNARYFSGIAKELGVPENTIRKCNNLYKAFVYLWHMLDPDKYQYSPSIVGRHDWEDPSDHAGMSQAEDDQVQILLDMPSFHTFNDMARWAYENGCWASFKKNYSLWRDIFLERSSLARSVDYHDAYNRALSDDIAKDAQSKKPRYPINNFLELDKPSPFDKPRQSGIPAD